MLVTTSALEDHPMTMFDYQRRLFVGVAILTLIALVTAAAAQQPDKQQTNILILVGPSTHPPGSHEVAAGGRLVAHCLEHAENVPGIKAEVIAAWPEDRP